MNNAKSFQPSSIPGFTKVESPSDVFPALVEIQGEAEYLLEELALLRSLNDEKVNVFVQMWDERLNAIIGQAGACCATLLEERRPQLALVS